MIFLSKVLDYVPYLVGFYDHEFFNIDLNAKRFKSHITKNVKMYCSLKTGGLKSKDLAKSVLAI